MLALAIRFAAPTAIVTAIAPQDFRPRGHCVTFATVSPQELPSWVRSEPVVLEAFNAARVEPVESSEPL